LKEFLAMKSGGCPVEQAKEETSINQLATCLLFDPENGGDMFLRNFG
jgi:hypothetical protein